MLIVFNVFLVSDASGRYSGNFLWGNTYWVGSATLCAQIKEMSFELGFYTLRVHIYVNNTITPYVSIGCNIPSVTTITFKHLHFTGHNRIIFSYRVHEIVAVKFKYIVNNYIECSKSFAHTNSSQI